MRSKKAHCKFVRDYNTQVHFAHRERKDIYTSTLKVEYQDTDLALYTVAWHEDNKRITEVTNPRVIKTGYCSPQLTLWTLGPDEWLFFKKLPEYAPRNKWVQADVIQLLLPGFLTQVELS